MTINNLPDELLVEIFDWCRLSDEYGWNHRRRWYKPLQVCRRWRYVMLESASRLKLRLLCSSPNPVAKMLMHSPPLPLIVSHHFGTFASTRYQEDILFALQHSDRVCSIFIREWGLAGYKLFRALDKAFSMLETLFLSSKGYSTRILPNNFMAPHLRTLHLENVDISAVSLFLINAANLISLHLDHIPSFGYFSSASLVEHISSAPRLENLSIKFIPCLPDMEMRLQRTQITRVVLHSLRRLIYTGVSVYLENFLALISTPLLQCFCVRLCWEHTYTLPHLSEFLDTIPNLDLRTAEVSFSSTSVSITYHSGQPLVFLPYLKFQFTPVHDIFNQVASVVQICNAIAPVLPVVQNLALENKENRNLWIHHSHWYAFILSFGDVETVRIDMALAVELSRVLHPFNRVLLPMLSELVVVSLQDLASNPFASFIDARRLAGHPIDFRVIRQRPPPHPFSTPWSPPIY